MTKRIEVFVRIRSCIDRTQEVWRTEKGKLYCLDRKEETCFDGYEGVFHSENNSELYQKSIKSVVEKFLKEENGTVFAYGQTGSGKTYTILGDDKNKDENGIIHLCLKDILKKETVNVSYLEVYNEKIYDLFTNNELRIYSVDNIHTISNLSSTHINSQKNFYEYLMMCETNRKYGITEFNKRSSRSHTIFQIKFRTSTFNLIDLAGSEKASSNESRRKEGGFINKSLLALCNLVTNLQNNKSHGCLGFRDSKLTRILQPSLDGRTNIVALCMITPQVNCIEESVATLKFAGRLANLKIKVSSKSVQEKIVFKIHDTDMKQGYYKEQYLKHYMGTKLKINEKNKIKGKKHESIKEDNNKKDNNEKDVKDFNHEDNINNDSDNSENINDSEESVEFKKNNDNIVEFKKNNDNIVEFKKNNDNIVEFKKNNDNIVDFYDLHLENQIQEERSLLLERINSLENMLIDILKKYPSKRTKEIFILEKHMFNLKLKKYKK